MSNMSKQRFFNLFFTHENVDLNFLFSDNMFRLKYSLSEEFMLARLANDAVICHL